MNLGAWADAQAEYMGQDVINDAKPLDVKAYTEDKAAEPATPEPWRPHVERMDRDLTWLREEVELLRNRLLKGGASSH